jgi:FlaG/FlaF family flagellin (archaellin)
MPQVDNLIVLVAVGVGLAGTVAMWLLGILMANGFVWPG